MSLKQAAIVPHPLMLIPGIGKENLTLLSKTTTSYRKLEESLEKNKIETIIIISSHGQIDPNVFTINESKKFDINFEEFGDYSIKMEVSNDEKLIKSFKEGFSAYQKLRFVNEKKLDHGNGVPICSLIEGLKNVKIVPIHISKLGLKEHFNFGKKLKNIIFEKKKKIAVIASGDLSHALTKKSPAPYSSRAVRFDQRLTEYLQNKKIHDILNLNEELIEEVKPCGLKSIVMLLGILQGVDYKIENLTYEAPFGVGYLTMQIDIV